MSVCMGWIENDTTDCVTSVHWTAVPGDAERTEITIRVLADDARAVEGLG